MQRKSQIDNEENRRNRASNSDFPILKTKIERGKENELWLLLFLVKQIKL